MNLKDLKPKVNQITNHVNRRGRSGLHSLRRQDDRRAAGQEPGGEGRGGEGRGRREGNERVPVELQSGHLQVHRQGGFNFV